MEVKNFRSAAAKMSEMHSMYVSLEHDYIDYSKDSNQLQHHVKSKFWYLNQYFALYHLCVEQDYAKARQRFYLAGRVGEYMNNVYGQQWFPYGSFHMYYALLSDAPELVRRYGLLENKISEPYRFKSCLFVDAVQRVIKGDLPALEEDIAALYAMKDKKSAPIKNAGMYADVFNAFLHRDLDALQTAILAFEKKTFKNIMQRHVGMYEHLISHHTSGLAKLAWYKGLPVEIDSPYVPKAMLPIASLPRYDERYHFLEGGQGIAGHLEE